MCPAKVDCECSCGVIHSFDRVNNDFIILIRGWDAGSVLMNTTDCIINIFTFAVGVAAYSIV